MKKRHLKRMLGVFMTVSLAAACLPLAFPAMAQTAAIPGAHIENGGFETGDLSGWSVDAAGSFAVTAEQKLYSSYAVKATGENAHLTQTVAVAPDTEYTVGFYSWVNTTGGTTDNGSGQVKTADGTETLAVAAIDVATAGKWRYNSMTFRTGAHTRVLVDICLQKGTVYFDEVYIKKSNNLLNYGDFPNASGAGWRGLNDTTTVDADNAVGTVGSSLRKTGGSSNNATYQPVTVTKNTDYILTFYSKGCDLDNKGFIALSELGLQSNAVGGAEWKASALKFNSGTKTKITLYIKATGVVYFDNISVVKAVPAVVTAGEGGQAAISGVTDGFAELGSSVTVTAAPDADRRFVGWYAGDTQVSAEESYTFPVTEAVNLTARFSGIDRAEILNSGFEADLSLADSGYSNLSGMTTVEITDAAAHTGAKSLYLANEKANSPHLFLKVAVTPNQEYAVRFFAKADGDSAPALQIKGTSPWGNSVLLNGFGISAKTQEWTEYYRTFNSGAHSVIYLDFFGSGKAFAAYIDDIAVATAVTITVGVDSSQSGGTVRFAGPYGNWCDAGTGRYLYGDTITVEAIPDALQKLLGWKHPEETEYCNRETSFTVTLTGDVELAAFFGFDGLGDLNGDGRLDVSDLMQLRRVLLGIIGPEDYVAAYADVNEDAEINIADLVALDARMAQLS